MAGLTLTAQESLDHWRKERRLIQTRLTGPPIANEDLFRVLNDNVSMADGFIRYYEARVAQESGKTP